MTTPKNTAATTTIVGNASLGLLFGVGLGVGDAVGVGEGEGEAVGLGSYEFL